MPRAVLSEARARRASAQLVAATQVQTAAAIDAVEAGVPPDLAATIASLESTAEALEATTLTLNTQVLDLDSRVDALEP